MTQHRPLLLPLTLLLASIGRFAFAQELPTELVRDRKPALKTNGNCYIKGGTILTITQGVIQDGAILIQNGKIVAIGKNIPHPAGVPVIDAAGKFIMPGIVDAHSHIAMDSVNEGSDSITADVRAHDVLNPKVPALYRALANGNTSALVLHGSANAIGGQSVVIKLKYMRPVEELFVPDAPRMVKFALGENVTRRGSGRFPSSRMGVEAVYRRAFQEAKQYIREWETYEKARQTNPNIVPPRRDLRLEALADILQGRIRVQCHSYRADEMLMMLRLSQEFGYKLVFQHALEAYKIAPEIAKAGASISTFANFWSYKVEAYEAIPYNVALCTQAGIICSLNSDNFGGTAHLNLEAGFVLRYGNLTEADALKLITINPAIQLGIERRAGSLEVGKDGDIAIWSGHPLSSYSLCAMTLVEGEVYFQKRDAFGLDKQATLQSRVNPNNIETSTLPLPRVGKSYAIVKGTVHPVSGAVIPEGTVLISNGKIVAVGSAVKIPNGTVIVNAKGLHVYPGLIDAGSHLGLTEIGSINVSSDSREEGSFQPDLRALTAVHPSSEHFAISRVAGITSTQTYPEGSLVAGQSATIHLDGWTSEQMVIKDANALHITFPEPPSEETMEQLREFLSPEEVQNIVKQSATLTDSLTEHFAKAKQYRDFRKHSSDYPMNLQLEAMIPYLDGAKPVVIHANSAKAMKQSIEFAEKNHLKMILADGAEAWRIADTLAKKQIPLLYTLPIVNSVEDGPSIRSYDPYDTLFSAPAILQKAGVKFAFQSGNATIVRNLPGQVGFCCAHGLPVEAALRAMTLTSAEILGIADRVGSLDVGKDADILVTDGDPLDFTTRLRYLFIAGKSVNLESKHTRLYQKYLERLSPKGN